MANYPANTVGTSCGCQVGVRHCKGYVTRGSSGHPWAPGEEANFNTTNPSCGTEQWGFADGTVEGEDSLSGGPRS